MRTRRVSGSALGLVMLAAAQAAAGETPLLASGRYEIEVKLELPHLEDTTGRSTTHLCLTSEAGANHHGLAVLSGNNPLATCPVSNLREEGDRLSFDVACEGRNAAKASALYVLAPESFRGRITMQMGGKNMTMTEVQSGRRTGTCETARTPGS